MIPNMFNIFLMEIAMFFVVVVCVYALVKTTSSMIKGIPNKWGDWFLLKPFKKLFEFGLPGEIKRWISLIYAFLISWVFKFQMISNMFTSYNKSRGSTDIAVSSFWNYMIVAGLLFAFSGSLYKIIEGFIKRHGVQKD